eukprot:gene12711-15029_t
MYGNGAVATSAPFHRPPLPVFYDKALEAGEASFSGAMPQEILAYQAKHDVLDRAHAVQALQKENEIMIEARVMGRLEQRQKRHKR